MQLVRYFVVLLYTGTRPASPSADTIERDTFQGSCLGASVQVTGKTRRIGGGEGGRGVAAWVPVFKSLARLNGEGGGGGSRLGASVQVAGKTRRGREGGGGGSHLCASVQVAGKTRQGREGVGGGLAAWVPVFKSLARLDGEGTGGEVAAWVPVFKSLARLDGEGRGRGGGSRLGASVQVAGKTRRGREGEGGG